MHPSRTCHWFAFLQPCAADGLGRGHSCAANGSRARPSCLGANGCLGQVAGARQRHAWLHREPSGSAVLQRSLAYLGRRHCLCGGHRCLHACSGISDGAFRTHGLDWPRRQLRRHFHRACCILWGLPLPAKPHPTAVGGRQLVGAQTRPRFLHLRRRCATRQGRPTRGRRCGTHLGDADE